MQYNAVKERYPDHVVLFQAGDFYEIYGEDAKAVAPELGLTLTTRPVPGVGGVEMCGLPVHRLEHYTNRLRRSHDILISAVPNGDTERREMAMQKFDGPRPYHIPLGSTVYIGTKSYEMQAIGDDIVTLYDPEFPLFTQEFPRADFDRKLEENPLNEHYFLPPEQDQAAKETVTAQPNKPVSPTLLRYTIRLLPNEGGIAGIWDAALNRFYTENGQILRFAEQDNAIAYLAGIQKSPNIEQAGPFFSTPLGNVYRVGDRVSEVDPDDPSPYVMDITQVTEDQVWFTIINVPENPPTVVDRTSFERYPDTGYYSLVENTEIIRNPGRTTSRFVVVVYHPFENGFDEKLDYPTLEEAAIVAQKYLDGSMKPDGFAYDGAAGRLKD